MIEYAVTTQEIEPRLASGNGDGNFGERHVHDRHVQGRDVRAERTHREDDPRNPVCGWQGMDGIRWSSRCGPAMGRVSSQN